VRPALGDVAVRARGLAGHLLSRQALTRLARASGSGVLSGLLQGVGYWSAPAEGGTARSAVDAVDAAIEHESTRRLAVLGEWLAERRALFVGVFEEEERRAIRIRLRRLVGGDARALAGPAEEPGAALSHRAHEELGRATDVAGLVAALGRIRSPYEEPLRRSLHSQGEDLFSLEMALDRTFAYRARRAAERLGGRLLDWVMDGIDLENAWSAVSGRSEDFVEGGHQLTRERHASIVGVADGRIRRRQLAEVFARSPLSAVFVNSQAPLAALETQALQARIVAERHAARLDPIGAAPILEVVMRMRAEWADLRRINWGIAQGLPTDAIVSQLMVTR